MTIVKSEDFTAMKGHVVEGCVIIAPSGKKFTLTNTMKGWRLVGPDGVECSGNLPSAFDVECFVVNGLQTH
jgi:hypothetical protein